MEPFRRTFPGFCAAALAIVSLPLAAQAAKQSLAGMQEGKPILQVERSVPFAVGKKEPEGFKAVQFRPADAMTEADRELEAGAESSIAERAGFEDLEFNEGKWNYEQIVCPALPNHLFLRFTRNNGAGDQSIFSVSIPRGGGRVRIIPILRRSYSLWAPAPINAITIAEFNRIRREDGVSRNSDWYGTALCYAALAGADPVVGPLLQDTSPGLPNTGMAEMEAPVKGGAIIRFIDRAGRPKPTLWTMTFDARGKLLKVKHVPADAYKEWMVPPSQANLKGKLLPATAKPPLVYRPIEMTAPAPAAARGSQ